MNDLATPPKMSREQLLAQIAQLERRIAREAAARRKAEDLLEARSFDLHNANQSLRAINGDLERIVAERTRELRAAHDEALAASRAKSQFLAGMSHELRTPLNAIIGFSEVMQLELQGPIGNAAYRDYAVIIHESGQHLLGIINDILDVAKIEAGRMELHEEVVDVAEVVADSVRLLSDRASRAGIKIKTTLPSGLPRLMADRGKIRQVLLNLLGNSIKFTGKDGTITVSARVSSVGKFLLTVADTGVGIPEDALESVMEAFVQCGDALTRSHHGSGLGLPLCKALTEMHCGCLTLESEVGKGTCVTISLPPQRVLDPAPAA
ncbi:sensor histidine kinase [Dongia sp.]|uniref:sensor histidine kinase n=1 Tax=Dongia sp. TaxID=1977262 RepID=UPI0037514F85